MAGWSQGAAYALALAHDRPDLVTAVALLAGSGPLDLVSGKRQRWPARELDLADRARADPAAVRPAVLADCARWAADPGQVLRDAPAGNPDFAGRPDVRVALEAMFVEAFRAGPDGLCDDSIASAYLPWGFDVADVRVPAVVWWGTADRLVAREDAEWFAATLPDARLEIREAVGHALPTACWAEVLARLPAVR